MKNKPEDKPSPAGDVGTLPARLAESAAAESQPETGRVPSSFTFTYLGVPFEATVTSDGVDGQSGQQVSLHANLGCLPFSAQSATARHILKRLLAATQALPRARFRLDETQNIVIAAELAIAQPNSLTRTVAGLTALLLEIGPYLRLIAEELAESAASTDRMTKPPRLRRRQTQF